jgi:hypothetical protein
MALMSLVGRGALSVAGLGARTAIGMSKSGLGRLGLSAGIGAATSLPDALSQNNTNNRLQTILEGAVKGASLYGAGAMTLGAAKYGIPKAFSLGTAKTMASGAASAVRASAKVAGRVLRTHPAVLAGGAATVGGLGYMATQGPGLGQPMSSPTMQGVEMNVNYNNQAH